VSNDENNSFGLGPIAANSHLPDVAIFLNPSENLGAIRECTASNVPTIGLVDTDCDPRVVTFAVPGNMEVSFRACRPVGETTGKGLVRVLRG
jgi:small subunit ribosomal protein S2